MNSVDSSEYSIREKSNRIIFIVKLAIQNISWWLRAESCPPNSCAEVLTREPWNVAILGDSLSGGHQRGPCSSATGVLLRGEEDTQTQMVIYEPRREVSGEANTTDTLISDRIVRK